MIRKHFLVVGILGLEPRMTGPESVVLPLHHIPKSNTLIAYLRLQNYYFFFDNAIISGAFFLKKQIYSIIYAFCSYLALTL